MTLRKLLVAASALAGFLGSFEKPQRTQRRYRKHRGSLCPLCLLCVLCGSTGLLAQWEPDRKLSTTDSAATLNENMGRCLKACADTLHVVWCDTRNNGSAIYYKRSSDQGTTWGEDTRLSGYPGAADFPTLAVSGPILHLAFRDSRSGDYRSYYKRSTDGGRTWGADVNIGDTSVFNWWPAIACVGSVVYVALNEDTVNSEVYFRRSTDNGATWDTIQRISNAPGRSEDPCIAAGGSCVHIVWNDFRNGGSGQSEVYYRRSSDQGLTWGPETRLTNAPGMSYSPTVEPSDSNVDIAFEDNRSGVFDIYHMRSTDMGVNWGAEERLTHDSVASFYPAVIADGPEIHMVWHDNTNQLTYLHSGDGGATWDPAYQLTSPPAHAGIPFIARTGPALHVIWPDQRDGHGAIYYKRNPTGCGMELGRTPDARRVAPIPTIVRGVLRISSQPTANGLRPRVELFDANGRQMMKLKTGDNDVSRLGAGVYFVRSEPSAVSRQPSAVYRVVIAR